MRKRRSSSMRVQTRHYCRECGSRVFPFDKYEDLTVSPRAGKRFGAVLLGSYNAGSPDTRVAWCWSCNAFVGCKRLVEHEWLQLYLARKGVVTRPAKANKKRRTA